MELEVPPHLEEAMRSAPGQHITIRANVHGDDVGRTYSICATGAGWLRIAVRALPGGLFSNYVRTEIREGDVVTVSPPAGRFVHHPGPPRRYVVVAAGSGITPVLPIVRSILASEPGSQVLLLFVNRRAKSVMFVDDLANLKDVYASRFLLQHLFTRETTGLTFVRDAAERHLLELASSLTGTLRTVDDWYVCGPQQLTLGLRTELINSGVAPGDIHIEQFGAPRAVDRSAPALPRTHAGSDDSVELNVRFRGRQITVDGSKDELLLDSLLRDLPDAPFSCRSGVCGTCRIRVMDGEVEMLQNFALEDDELARGLVLGCQGLPRTHSLSLDLDERW